MNANTTQFIWEEVNCQGLVKEESFLKEKLRERETLGGLGVPMSPVVTPLPLLHVSNLEPSHMFPKQVLHFTQEKKRCISVHSKALCKGKIHFIVSQYGKIKM